MQGVKLTNIFLPFFLQEVTEMTGLKQIANGFPKSNKETIVDKLDARLMKRNDKLVAASELSEENSWILSDTLSALRLEGASVSEDVVDMQIRALNGSMGFDEIRSALLKKYANA